MNILNLENVSKNYSEKKLLHAVSMGVDDSDRIGIVGINGTGKSTLLKLIAGTIEPDSGKITKSNSISIQGLTQAPEFMADMTVLEQIFHSDNVIMKTIKEYEQITSKLSESPEEEKLQNELMVCSMKMDQLDAWNIETQARTILSKLGIPDTSLKMGELSGGQKKRVAMAEALIQPADLLILDEPTNHIDFETINWLEDYLRQRKGALILVTHDRYFLNRVVNRIVEIDKGSLYSYAGNFENFLEMKMLREEMESSMDQKCRRLYASELQWIRRGARARTTKQKSRIERFEQLQEDISQTTTQEELDVPVAYTRLGKKVIEIENVSKSFDGNTVIKDFSILIKPTDRIGIIGPNGAGKTTLLNLIAGLIAPDSGTIDIGETVKISYYRQNNEDMDYSLRVIDYIKQTAEYVEASNGYMISASQMLERFLFDGSQQYSLIKNLSGGERRRLLLAKVLIEKPNVLLLDEPTNDLDIQTLEVLEEYLEHFQGAVLVVSHDRYFLDKTTDKLLAVKSDGRLEPYNDLEAYSRSLETVPEEKSAQKKDKNSSRRQNDENKKRKMTFSEKRELEQIEGVIENIESSLKEIGAGINACGADYILLQELTDKQVKLQFELSEKMNRWAYLMGVAEQA